MLEPDARVLVIQVARIGDTLLTTPVLRALKAALPRGMLGCLVHPGRAPLLCGLPFIDWLGSIRAKTAHWRGWCRRQEWNYALVYGHDASLIGFALRVARRVVAFRQGEDTIDRRLWRAVPEPTMLMHAVAHRLLLAQALGVGADDLRLAYAPQPKELARARAWLQRSSAPHGRPLVGLQVASFPTKSYRDWPLDSFARLGENILSRYPHARLLILGGSESRGKARELVARLGPRARAAAGVFDLRGAAALMAQLDLYIGVDTGPTHLAGALGIPMVALYHCRHRGRYLAPVGHERLRVIEHPTADADCRPNTPMSEITVECVWNAVQQLLGPAQTTEPAEA